MGRGREAWPGAMGKGAKEAERGKFSFFSIR